MDRASLLREGSIIKLRGANKIYRHRCVSCRSRPSNSQPKTRTYIHVTNICRVASTTGNTCHALCHTIVGLASRGTLQESTQYHHGHLRDTLAYKILASHGKRRRPCRTYAIVSDFLIGRIAHEPFEYDSASTLYYQHISTIHPSEITGKDTTRVCR